MYLRILGLALLTTSSLLPAQPPTPATPTAVVQDPVKQEPAKQEPAKQDPDRPQPTVADRIAELERERERLTKEIEFARERVAKAGSMLQDKLSNRKLAVKAIDAGTNAPAPTAVAAPRTARVASPEEAKQIGDALLMVNQRPVTKQQVSELIDYQRTYPSSGTDELRMHRAMLDVIRTEATLASFADHAKEAESAIADLHAQAAKGANLAEIAKTRSQGPGSQEGGKVEVTRNSFHGLKLEQVAFATKEGELSPVFRTPMGFAFLKVDKFEKGESADTDKVQATLVQLNYFADANEMRQVQGAVATGQVDIAVRDEKVLEMLPVMFRPAKETKGDLIKQGASDPEKAKAQAEEAAKAQPIKIEKKG